MEYGWYYKFSENTNSINQTLFIPIFRSTLSEQDDRINPILEALSQLISKQDATSSKMSFLNKQINHLREEQTHYSNKAARLLKTALDLKDRYDIARLVNKA